MKKKNRYDKFWVEIGIKSFARYFDLSIEEAYKIINNPNNIALEMMSEMHSSLDSYEDFMVKVKRTKEKEELTRADIIDL